MSSTFGGLNTVVRGLAAQQLSLDTVGHNISNASTEGYSRQRVNLATTNPLTIYAGAGQVQLGTGVAPQSITRARDTFIDRQMWKESSTLGYGQTTYDTLSKIEGVFQEPKDSGMQSVLNEYWKAWNTLSTNASDNGVRTALRERGVELVDTIQHANTQLRDMVSDINSVIKIKVDNVNQITSELSSLNKQISLIELGKTDNANDLRDRRDLLVDQLSVMMDVHVSEDQNGNYLVQTAGMTLVDAKSANKLGVSASVDSDYNFEVLNVVNAEGQQINFTNGEIKGLIAARDDSNIGAKAYLDKLAATSNFLLQDFNSVHRSGYGTDETTGNDFFGKNLPADLSELDSLKKYELINLLEVNPALFSTAGLGKIAAKKAGEGNAAGSMAVELAQSLKVTQWPSLGNSSLDTYYSSFIGALGVQTQNAKRLTENQQTLVNQIGNWRESVAGVNMDEEMSNMIRFQKGYNAAARILTTMDEMLDKLINNTGVVGR